MNKFGQLRKERISIRCSEQEKNEMERRAKKANLSLSKYLVEVGTSDSLAMRRFEKYIVNQSLRIQESINEVREIVKSNDASRETILKGLDELEKETIGLWQN